MSNFEYITRDDKFRKTLHHNSFKACIFLVIILFTFNPGQAVGVVKQGTICI